MQKHRECTQKQLHGHESEGEEKGKNNKINQGLHACACAWGAA